MGFLAAIPAIIGVGAADAGAIGAATLGVSATAEAAAAAATAGTSLASGLATAGEVASLAGGAIGALGSLESGAAQKNAALYQSQVSANNVQVARYQAQQAAATGEAQEEAQGLKTRAQLGAITAAQGASNVNVNEGSAVDVRSSAADLGELDALTIRSNAQKQVFGYETAATSFQGQEGLAQSQAAQAPIAAGIGATSSLLSGASGAASQYLNWQRVAGATNANASPQLF